MADKYKKYTHEKERTGKMKGDPGPVVTISREFGCPSREIAELLHFALCQMEKKSITECNWKVLKKEILDEAGKVLNIAPQKLEYVFNAGKKSMAKELIDSFSQKYYKSDRKIRKTIKDVIYNIGHEGNAIIIGRAGVAITRKIPNSLHVRLIAPLNWRAERAAAQHNVDVAEMEKTAMKIDEKRWELIQDFSKNPVDDSTFDLLLNCQRLKIDQIVEIIIGAMKSKAMIPD